MFRNTWGIAHCLTLAADCSRKVAAAGRVEIHLALGARTADCRAARRSILVLNPMAGEGSVDSPGDNPVGEDSPDPAEGGCIGYLGDIGCTADYYTGCKDQTFWL